MPIIGFDDDEELIHETPNLVINENPYVSQVVDTRKEGYDTLTGFVNGSKWTVDFFKQVQRRDNASASFQGDLPKPYGQYHEVRGLELVVTQPLEHSQDGEARGWVTRGAAVVYSVVTPNEGDAFIADIGDGRNAIFTVTSTKRTAPFAEAPTQIEYRSTQFLTADSLKALKDRVVKTYVFSKENFRNGVKALLTTEEVDVNRRLGAAYSRLLGLYLKDFFSRQYHTLLVPSQTLTTYDPHLTRFFKATVDGSYHPLIGQITAMGVYSDELSYEQTLFDAILNNDATLLHSVSTQAGISSIGSYRTRPQLNSIYYSGIKQVVSVTDIPVSADQEAPLAHAFIGFERGATRTQKISHLLPDLDLTDDPDVPAIPYIHPAMESDYYVCSKAFYEDTAGQSRLESMLLARLRGEGIDLQVLAEIADAAPTFENLDRFYYVPIILALIKLAPGVL